MLYVNVAIQKARAGGLLFLSRILFRGEKNHLNFTLLPALLYSFNKLRMRMTTSPSSSSSSSTMGGTVNNNQNLDFALVKSINEQLM